MKVTIDIPDKELFDLMRYSGVRTKRGAIIRAIREFNRERRLGKAAEILGTFKAFMREDG